MLQVFAIIYSYRYIAPYLVLLSHALLYQNIYGLLLEYDNIIMITLP